MLQYRKCNLHSNNNKKWLKQKADFFVYLCFLLFWLGLFGARRLVLPLVLLAWGWIWTSRGFLRGRTGRLGQVGGSNGSFL